MGEIIKLNKQEKRHYFLYLIILFAIVVSSLTWVIFRKSHNPFNTVSNLDAEFLAKEKYFLDRQKEVLPLCDSVFSKISTLKTMPSTIFFETDIKNEINTVNSFDESNIPNKDPRLAAFHQIALFQKLYFEDILILKRKLQNIESFKSQLDQCEIGYKDKQTFMNQLKAADQSKEKQ